MPYVHRIDSGVVRAWSLAETAKCVEWLDEDHPDLVEYQSYIESQTNPTPPVRAGSILQSPVNKIILGAMLDQENRIRALEGQEPYLESDYIKAATDKYLALAIEEQG